MNTAGIKRITQNQEIERIKLLEREKIIEREINRVYLWNY